LHIASEGRLGDDWRARQTRAIPKAAAVYHKGNNVVTPLVDTAHVAGETYKRVLQHADEFFDAVMRSQPQNLQCGRGCSLCCYGLFEIGSADVVLIAEGLAKLHAARRAMVIRRAVEIVATSRHPNLRDCSPIEKEEFFDRTASTPCPNLNDSGECMIYDDRPLVCRTFGLPLRNGARYLGDVCDLNFNDATQQERLEAAWDLQWEDELGPEDEYTIPEAIVLAARMRGWLTSTPSPAP
jgi:Fe-S-cluster containining protein